MEPENITWKPFSYTHVVYPEGDSFGKLMAFVSLFPIALIVGNFSLILFRRDLHSVSGFWVSFQYFILSFFIAPSFFSDDDDHDRHYFKKNNCNKEKL